MSVLVLLILCHDTSSSGCSIWSSSADTRNVSLLAVLVMVSAFPPTFVLLCGMRKALMRAISGTKLLGKSVAIRDRAETYLWGGVVVDIYSKRQRAIQIDRQI